MQNFKKTKLAVAFGAMLILSGCSVESKPWVNDSRVEIHDDQFTDTFETAKLNNSVIHAIANYYYRYGNGPMNVVVSYDPKSKVNTKAAAEQALVSLRNGLAQNGIEGVRGTTSALSGSGDISTTLISFQALTASAPQGCKMMPGYDNPADDIPNGVNGDPPYKYGCTVESLLAKQVSRPADLLGKQGFETNADGRRQERVISTHGYYDDKSNESLDGEKATDD